MQYSKLGTEGFEYESQSLLFYVVWNHTISHTRLAETSEGLLQGSFVLGYLYNLILQYAIITFIWRSFSDSGSEWVIMRAPSPAAAASEAPVTKGI